MRRFIKERTFNAICNLDFGLREEGEVFLKKKVIFAGVELTDKELLVDRENRNEEKAVCKVRIE